MSRKKQGMRRKLSGMVFGSIFKRLRSRKSSKIRDVFWHPWTSQEAIVMEINYLISRGFAAFLVPATPREGQASLMPIYKGKIFIAPPTQSQIAEISEMLEKERELLKNQWKKEERV